MTVNFSGAYLQICQEQCGVKRTKEEILNSLECNFCDLPYIILEIENEQKKKGD